jgi:hypothetical protein
MVLTLLVMGWALVIMPNRDSYTGNLALLSLGKLINQLKEIVFALEALAVVFDIVAGVKPVVSATSASSISGLTGTREY